MSPSERRDADEKPAIASSDAVLGGFAMEEPRRSDNERSGNEAPCPAAGETHSITEGTPSSRSRVVGAFILMLLLGCGFRAWLVATPGLGEQQDLKLFTHWIRGIHEHGIEGFFRAVSFCDYTPGMLLIFRAAGEAAAIFSPDLASERIVHIALKVPPCLADLLIAILLFIEGARLLGPRLASAAAALWFLNPAVIYDSAYWGQVDSIYTAVVLLGFLFLGRRLWLLAGAATGVAMLTKFQAIAFVPLLLFETYRVGRWKGIGVQLVAAIAAAAVVLSPFIWTGTTRTVLERSYVNVIGQYNELAKGAFNTWQLTGDPGTADTAVPAPIVHAVADGDLTVHRSDSWWLWFTWRHLSLVLYSLVVAVVLSTYSLKPRPVALYGAAGLLGLAFFLFPTEMHERYAVPALAFLALWAASARARERVFLLFSALLVLNLAAVLSPEHLAAQIAAANLILFLVIIAALWRQREEPATGDRCPLAQQPAGGLEPRLIPWFRRLTVIASVAAVGVTGFVAVRYATAQRQPVGSALFLSDLTPVSARQGWKNLRSDRTVSGGVMGMNDILYLKGLGTHSPARLVYEIPEGMTRFRATIGVDQAAKGHGSIIAIVELDGKEVFRSERITGKTTPVDIDIDLQGAERITLRSDATSDGQRSDHANWALARFE